MCLPGGSVCPGSICLGFGCLPGCLPRGCLPRGCLPGRYLPRGYLPKDRGVCPGVSAQGGVCGGGCLWRGVSAWGCLPKGGVCPGGICPRIGVSARGCLPRGCLPRMVSAWGVSKYAHRQTSPWPQRQTPPSLMWTEFLTHTCENVTFPQLCLRTVKITNLVNFTSDKKILVQINLTYLIFKVKAIQKCQWVHSFLTSQLQRNGVLRRCAKTPHY